MRDLNALDFTKGNGLVTVVTQDFETGAVLMVAHADREALTRTLETGRCTIAPARAASGTRARRAGTSNTSFRSPPTAMGMPSSRGCAWRGRHATPGR